MCVCVCVCAASSAARFSFLSASVFLDANMTLTGWCVTRQLLCRLPFRNEPRCPAPSPAPAFHQHVLFSSFSSLSSSSCTPFLPPSDVQMYSQCISHVLRMTKLAAILAAHSAKWIGKYRALEEWRIHLSVSLPSPCAYSQRKDFFFALAKENAHQLQMNKHRWMCGSQRGWKWCKGAQRKGDWFRQSPREMLLFKFC